MSLKVKKLIVKLSKVYAVTLELIWSSLLESHLYLKKSIEQHFNTVKENNNEANGSFEFGYSYDDQSLISRLSVVWILPLLRRGYSSPLETEDLRSAPPTESAQSHFENLSKILTPTNVISSCLRQNCKLILVAGIARFFADLFSLAGAVCIKLVVQSMSSNSTNQDAVNADDVSSVDDDFPEASWSDFLNDSRVIATFIFLAGIFQGIFSQTSTHFLTVAGSRAMTSLQVPILFKICCLICSYLHYISLSFTGQSHKCSMIVNDSDSITLTGKSLFYRQYLFTIVIYDCKEDAPNLRFLVAMCSVCNSRISLSVIGIVPKRNLLF